jgi:hypothetical protein
MAHLNPANLIEADSELTIDKLKTGFSYIKESTSSNPDGLHHGHWKMLIKDKDAFKPYALSNDNVRLQVWRTTRCVDQLSPDHTG